MGDLCFILIHPRSGFHNYSSFIFHFSSFIFFVQFSCVLRDNSRSGA